MRSILSRVLPKSPEQLVTEKLRELRAIEASHPYLPRFDESRLPSRRAGESTIAWRRAQLDALQVWVRGVIKVSEELEARAKTCAALQMGGVA